jgi:hypothetical protein
MEILRRLSSGIAPKIESIFSWSDSQVPADADYDPLAGKVPRGVRGSPPALRWKIVL